MSQHINVYSQKGCIGCKRCEGGAANVGRTAILTTIMVFTGGLGAIAFPFAKKCQYCGHNTLMNKHGAPAAPVPQQAQQPVINIIQPVQPQYPQSPAVQPAYPQAVPPQASLPPFPQQAGLPQTTQPQFPPTPQTPPAHISADTRPLALPVLPPGIPRTEGQAWTVLQGNSDIEQGRQRQPGEPTMTPPAIPQVAKKPWYKRIPWWGWVAVGIVVVVAALVQGSGEPEQVAVQTPTRAATPTPTPTPTPTGEPTPTPTPKPTKLATDKEIVTAFQDFIDERAAAGVIQAKAVTDITYKDRVVRVTFDPRAAGISQETFDATNAYENLAEFAGVPIMFDDKLGDQLRPAIDKVVAVTPDKTSEMTTAELYYNGTGKDLATGLEKFDAPQTEAAEPAKTSGGMDDVAAFTWCERYGKQQYPHGFKMKMIFGSFHWQAEYKKIDDSWLIVAPADITDATGAKYKNVKVVCVVTGTDLNGTVSDFHTE